MSNNLSTNTIWRSNINEKKNLKYYNTSSDGRDGYILNKSVGGDPFGSSFMLINRQVDKPCYNDKKIKYYSDGQGRDAYIIKNYGGLFSDGSGSDQKRMFLQTLRSYQTMKKTPQIKFITTKDIETQHRQKNNSLVLSKPKFIDPVKLNEEIETRFKNRDFNIEKGIYNSKMLQTKTPKKWATYFQKSFQIQNSQYSQLNDETEYTPSSSGQCKLPHLTHLRQKTHA